jgi:hypothetical protein
MHGLIIAYIGGGALPTPEEVRAPGTSGLLYCPNWERLEPHPGDYRWDSLDAVVDLAWGLGKSVMLGVKHGVSGQGLPAWYAGPALICRCGWSVPLWWTPGFTAPWHALITALVARYAAHPAVGGFVLTGFYGQRFAEMGNCPGWTAADAAPFLAAGYARAHVRTAALALLDVMASRTRKPLRLAYSMVLNETTGLCDLLSLEAYVLGPLIEAAGSQVYVGHTTLTPRQPDPLGVWNRTPPIYYYRPLRTYAAHSWWQVDTPARGGPVTPEDWLVSLDLAAHGGAAWVEVRRTDAGRPDLRDIFVTYDAWLREGGR